MIPGPQIQIHSGTTGNRMVRSRIASKTDRAKTTPAAHCPHGTQVGRVAVDGIAALWGGVTTRGVTPARGGFPGRTAGAARIWMGCQLETSNCWKQACISALTGCDRAGQSVLSWHSPQP